MTGRVEGKVAFITGAARGQGRSHAIRLAQEGADIIAIDLLDDVASIAFPLGTSEDLAETVREVEALGRRIVATQADVRDYAAVKRALDDGVAELGKLDIVLGNAGIAGSNGTLEQITTEQWDDMIGIDLTGVWHTLKASIPHLKANGSGSIVLTASTAGVKGVPNIGHYVAAKHGVIGLMRTAAIELAPFNIRANAVLPTAVNTGMIRNEPTYELFAPDLAPQERTLDIIKERFGAINLLPIPWVEPIDVSNGVLWLASDEARYVTGLELRVDAGLLVM